jgi:hypothetical protein
MPNITVTVSEEAYRNARVWAAQNDTSISAVVQYCIERLPGLPIAQSAAASTRRPRETHPGTLPGAPPSPGMRKMGCEPVNPPATESNQALPVQNLTGSQNHSA